MPCRMRSSTHGCLVLTWMFHSRQPELFVTRENRYCTDILFLIAFIAAWVGGITIAAVSINKDTSLLTNIRYPADSYGNNCGEPGTATEGLPKVIYPFLDQDIHSQLDVFLSYRYWEFTPTRMCAPSCPGKFNFQNPVIYGGADYPCGYDVSSGTEVSSGSSDDLAPTCTAGSVPEVYYTWYTQDVVDRCLPIDDSATSGSIDLCSQPACTAVDNSSLAGSVHCRQVEAYPAEQPYAWEVCGAGTEDLLPGSATTTICAAQTAACKKVLTMTRSDLFSPVTQTADSAQYTEDLADYIKMVVGGVEGLLVDDAIIAQVVFGLVVPLLLAFVWAVFLWFFAGA